MEIIQEVPSRENIELADTWNTETLYKNQEEWIKDFNAVRPLSSTPFWPELSKSSTPFSSAQALKEFLDLMFSKERILDKLYVYAHLHLDQDLKNDLSQKYFQQILALCNQFNTETSWFSPELLACSDDLIADFLQTPELTSYKFFLEKILRMKKYTKTQNEELLLASAKTMISNYQQAFSSLSDAEIPFSSVKNFTGKELPLSHGLYHSYMQSEDRTLRKNAYETQLKRYDSYQMTFASLLEGHIKSHVFYSKARSFDSCLQAALYPNQIPLEVYTHLIKSIRQHLPVIHEYFLIKKRALRLESLRYYDVYAPLIDTDILKFTYDEAVDLIITSLAPLGSEYQNVLKSGLTEQRWVDRYENKNKCSGAYSSGCFDSVPYILMNFQGFLSDVSTLAHEAGHSMHSYYSNRGQNFHDARYPIFLAEIASTFNEGLLINHLFNVYSKNTHVQINLLTKQIDGIIATLIRQTMFAEFELIIHRSAEQQIPLTSEFLKQTYSELLRDYLGKAIDLNISDSLEWARIPHFYYNFYVYQYATGISAALYFVQQVLSNKDPKIVDNYLIFLHKGGSRPPLTILKEAGVDMTDNTVVTEAFAFLSNQINSLKKLV